MRQHLIARNTAVAALILSIAACSSGSGLSSDQKTASKLMQDNGMSVKDADCIAGKLSGDALSLVRRDPDFSDLAQDTTNGPKVADAYTSCTGKNFEDTFHYNPADGD